MGVLLLGLVLFLGVHSARIVANDARTRFIAQRGEGLWKGLYSLASVLGFVLILWGYGQARLNPTVLWASPVWARHLASLLNLVAFVLLVAAYVPRNGIKARLHHGVALWMSGRREEAVRAFGEVKGADGSAALARIWSLFARSSAGRS